MDQLYEKLLADIPEYETFLTAEELDASSRKLAEEHPECVELFSIGKSRDGHDLLCLKIGSGKKTALMFGLPHPNEPIGTMMLEYLTKALAESPELRERFGYTLYVVKAWDYDGYLLNEGWVKGPYTITNYSTHFFRPVSSQQVDWTFPIDYKELHFHDVMPEAQAMMGLIEKIRPDFIYSLHNSGFGGVYWYFTKDQDHDLYEELYEAPRRQNIPIHFGEPESPALKVFYPAVFEGGGIEVEYDYMEKYGVKNIAEEIGSGTCSDEFANKLCGAITFLTEMPYFYDARINDTSVSDMTRGEAIREKIDWERKANEKLKDALNLSMDAMDQKNPFLMAIVGSMKESGEEAQLKMIEEDPIYQTQATKAEKFDSVNISKFYRLLGFGMLVRANELELARVKDAEKRAKLEQGKAAAQKIYDELAVSLEQEMHYSVIPIRKLVTIQLECGLKVADYLLKK